MTKAQRKVDKQSFFDGLARVGECWEWPHGRHADGYGRVRRNGQEIAAHRFAFALVHGPIPEGRVICHRCDNPACCRPDHLFIGTQTDNVQDMLAKGRGRDNAGEMNPAAKLSRADVESIRRDSRSYSKLAKLYGVHLNTIYNARSGRCWRD